ncbi:MAG: hypothetical protein ACPGSI_17195 [Pikeienuella sp.]
MPDFLTLSEFKDYMQVTWTEDDTTFTALLDAAESYLADPDNGILGRPVITTAFSEEFDSLPEVRIAHPDGASITTVTYTDTDGQAQTLGDIFRLKGDCLVLNYGETWPAHIAPVTVAYSAGFATAPQAIKTAGYFYAASLFEQRDSEKMNPETLRRVIAMMVAGYRRIGL